MKIAAYHASSVKIDTVKIKPNGFHMGTMLAAGKAINQHLGSGETFYMHTYIIDTDNFVTHYDVGHNWGINLNYNDRYIFEYENEYEVSDGPSYVTFNTDLIQLVGVEVFVYDDYGRVRPKDVTFT